MYSMRGVQKQTDNTINKESEDMDNTIYKEKPARREVKAPITSSYINYCCPVHYLFFLNVKRAQIVFLHPSQLIAFYFQSP